MNLSEELSMMCDLLGPKIEVGGKLVLPSGVTICPSAIIPCLGGIKGTVVVSSSDAMKGREDEIVSAGFGYSVLSEPSSDPRLDSSMEESLEIYMEMFAEWGWTGEPGNMPEWMK